MTTINPATYPYRPISVGFTQDEVVVTLANGEVLRHPLAWHSWLASATPQQRTHVELDAFAVNWPELDDGLDIEAMRRDIPSDYDMQVTYYEQQEEDAQRLAARIEQLPPDKRRLVGELVTALTQHGHD